MYSRHMDDKILRALSNENRKRILEQLYFNNYLEYAELMKRVGFKIGESGKFAYHSNKLEEAELIKKRIDGKYELTSKGRKIVKILLEENIKDVDPITDFSKNINVDLYAISSIIMFAGLFSLIYNSILLILAFLNLPARIVIMGQVYVRIINVHLSFLMLFIGGTLTLLSLYLLKKSGTKYTFIEKIVLQKYLFLILVNRGSIGKYLFFLVLAIIFSVVSSFIPLFF
ncbi:MAG: helix-turn-helix transcriptional regulator [Thermoproteales archaeon]|nr:helix-turn-helix transcriptional regulator [Thermoproteales archaeon]